MSETLPLGTPLPEDRFTEPTARCPHPGWWTSTDSESTEVEVAELVYGLVRALQPRYVLETGTAFGVLADKIVEALYANNHGWLYSIEVDPERASEAKHRFRHSDLCAVIDGRSLDWRPPHDVVFDLVYLDAYYRERVAEFDHFRPWMRTGTIVCLHDTAPGHGREQGDDIMTTVARGLRGKARLIHLPTPRGLTIAEVLP